MSHFMLPYMFLVQFYPFSFLSLIICGNILNIFSTCQACSRLGNLDNILKSRDITFPTKVCLVKAMVFPVVMYGCESWTKKKAERWKTDTFELWYRRRLFRIPWTARRTNQSILKEISLEYSLEGLMLKLQYFDHLMQRTDTLEKNLIWERLKAGGKGENRG